LLADAKSGQTIQQRKRSGLVGSAVIQAIQDVAMEIDEAHGGWRV
jgi:hypothetical protein